MHGRNMHDGILQDEKRVLNMSYFYFEAKEFEKILDVVEKFADGAEAEKIINEYLHEEGGKQIKEKIRSLLPVSGRTWNGKKAAASQTDPLKPEGGNLSVVVRTKYGYHYLYFPDDGSNTERHEGNQQFMFKGAEGVADEVVNGIIDKLVNRLEEL